MPTSSGESTEPDEPTQLSSSAIFGSAPTRPLCATIDLAALRSNYRQLRAIAVPAQMIAVIKADAYGHGAVPVARTLLATAEPGPPAMLGVATINEGLSLREAGITTPILLLSAILPEAAAAVVESDLTATVFTRELAVALDEAARARGTVARAHFKVDTGLRRLGIWYEEAAALYEFVRSLPHLQIGGFYTHLACADNEDPATTMAQLADFRTALRACGHDPDSTGGAVALHIANSAATLRHPEARFDLVRPGLSLYGLYPGPHAAHKEVRLKPVMSLLAKITDIKTVPAGDPVSYGATWKSPRLSRIAVVPAGYADGYHRLLSNRASVAIAGHLCPVVGRVTMDQILVDCTEVGLNAQPGSDVTLWGRGPGGTVAIDDLANFAETITYELVCGVAKRVPRVYLNEAV